MEEDGGAQQAPASSRRAEPFDWSQPAFEPQEARDRAVDALPLSPRQRRAVWWQVVVMALVRDAATVALVVASARGGVTALLGLAVITAPGGAVVTWAAWSTRRLRRGRTAASPTEPEGP